VSKFISITQLTNLLELKNQKSRKPQNYILRYWEKEFTQIKPKILNKRRYYSAEQVELIKLIKYLIREKGITINGVKNILKKNINKLDDYNSYSLKAEYYKKKFEEKSEIILKKVKKLKKYGKKNSY
tara:strand:+ start:939 stop:1319 length:381 start_codon:yes stop_codon:yes gene_type:complete